MASANRDGTALRTSQTAAALTPAASDIGRPHQVSTRIAFGIAGFGMAAWAPLVPFVRARAMLSEGALGLLLLCLGAGSIVAMPLAGSMCGRFGCRRVIVVASALICLALPILAVASSIPVLVGALFLFGAAVGSVDCSVNIQAVIVERASGRPMMSGFHGLFSFGGIAAAAGVSSLLVIGAMPLVAMLGVDAVLIALLVVAAPNLLPRGAATHGPAFAIPRGIVLLIGALCFIAFLTEGAALDWSAVFLTSVRGMPASYAGLGYAAFAAAMTAGRLTGDWIVRKLGGLRVIVGGALCAALGLSLATLLPAWEAAIAGYALVGIGCSNIVPVLYTAVGRQKVMPEHAAVPAITTLGYAGILAGPAAIGAVAHASSLSVALLAVAVLLLAVAGCGKMLRL
jgi:predicted MFS family arabinose efflux permease